MGEPVIREALELGLQAWRATEVRAKFHAAFAALDRLEHEGLVVWAIVFDSEQFGVFRTLEAAQADLARQIAGSGPAWEDCQIVGWRLRDE